MTDPSYDELLEFLYVIPIAVLKCNLHGAITVANPKCANTFLSVLKFDGFPNFMELLSSADKALVAQINNAKQPGQICRNHRIWIDVADQEVTLSLDIYLSGNNELLVAFRDVIETAEYEKKLERLSKFDELTQLANRRFFMETAELEIQRSHRYGRPLSILIADLDYFKQVNDTYGHISGGTVLETIGRILRTDIRETDMAARLGGEEFCILLPETDLTDAERTAEHIRTTVGSCNIEISGKSIHVTLSLGVAQLKNGETLQKLISRADQALYRAKSSGRNRVEPG
jgi:diguanylate cyclase (GGDEF)-like protein